MYELEAEGHEIFEEKNVKPTFNHVIITFQNTGDNDKSLKTSIEEKNPEDIQRTGNQNGLGLGKSKGWKRAAKDLQNYYC